MVSPWVSAGWVRVCRASLDCGRERLGDVVRGVLRRVRGVVGAPVILRVSVSAHRARGFIHVIFRLTDALLGHEPS